MPQKIILTLVILLNSGYCLGQIELVGQVVDALTKEPLPYVNIWTGQ